VATADTVIAGSEKKLIGLIALLLALVERSALGGMSLLLSNLIAHHVITQCETIWLLLHISFR